MLNFLSSFKNKEVEEVILMKRKKNKELEMNNMRDLKIKLLQI